MRKFKVILLTSAIALLLLFTGCSKNIKTVTIGDANAKVKILICSKKTEYKEELIADLTGKMEKMGYYIKVTGLNKLKREKIENYSALILLNDLEMGKLNLNVQKYITKHSDSKKIILFTTAGSPEEWSPETKIHAITTASETTNITTMSARILARVAAIAR